MNEKPILFKPEMVKAILDGRKSQTRRVVKGKALEWLAPDMFKPEFVALPENYLSPYGYAGDLIWVRESFQQVGYMDGKFHLIYSDGTDVDGLRPSQGQISLPVKIGLKKILPIHMPRWACRLVLEITDVRIERVQDISEEDAMSEGLIEMPQEETDMRWNPIQAFKHLWNSIHNKDGYDWDMNPWAWVITFKKVEP